MATLYEIDAAIMACIDMETGEIIDTSKLEELEMERNQKIENVALLYKNTISEMKAYKTEKDSFARKEMAARKLADRLEGYLQDALGDRRFKTTRVSISYRRSESVECENLDAVPKDYLVMAPSLDKTAVKQALKEGIEVPGCGLLEKQNIQIR